MERKIFLSAFLAFWVDGIVSCLHHAWLTHQKGQEEELFAMRRSMSWYV